MARRATITASTALLLGLALTAPLSAQATRGRSLDPAASGGIFSAPALPPLDPVYGPLATTTTAGPGARTGGVTIDPNAGRIAADDLVDPNSVIGKPKPRRSTTTESSGGSSRVTPEPLERTGGTATLASCMELWDKSTHMSRAAWRRACQRSLNGIELSPARNR
jgi:hypothetical protein